MCALPKPADWSDVNDPTEAPPALTPPDYEHIPACMWPPNGCLVETDPLWHLTGRRIQFYNGCCITIAPRDHKGMWNVYPITVDAGELPDLRHLVNYVHQRLTIWDEPEFAPTLKRVGPNTFALEVW